MKKIIYLSVMLLVIAGLTLIFNNKPASIEITCPDGVEIDYYYQPGCHACGLTEPIIDSMIERGCSVNLISLRENPESFVLNDIEFTPTLIVNGNRLTGAFTLTEVKDLINNSI
ncbi:MAG: hypothetical protein WC307_00565 [Candidatus Nanoarchaeia archaeon]|jgi:hypothetical protein